MGLGRLMAGMLAGAAAAAALLLAGGSLALAFGIYSLVGVTASLAMAFVSFRLSERRDRTACATTETEDPAD